jgi:predicted pyridoxine 5'-phosphate oxidase superfamily flavin-nucleotide-binding protein
MGSEERLAQALALAADVGTILVATADAEGRPHMAVAGKIIGLAHRRVAVSEWFCPGTVGNLDKNPLISLVVWNPG